METKLKNLVRDSWLRKWNTQKTKWKWTNCGRRKRALRTSWMDFWSCTSWRKKASSRLCLKTWGSVICSKITGFFELLNIIQFFDIIRGKITIRLFFFIGSRRDLFEMSSCLLKFTMYDYPNLADILSFIFLDYILLTNSLANSLMPSWYFSYFFL